MQKTRKTIYILLWLIGMISVACSYLSIFRNAQIRYFKMLDFPRIQLFITLILFLVFFPFSIKRWGKRDYFLIGAAISGVLIHIVFLVNYTFLATPQVPDSMENETSERMSILLTNVKMTNRNAQPLLQMIKLKNPDLILAMEVDDWWGEKLKPIERNYPYTQETINDVAYGMVLYSKFPLKKVEVHYLNNEKVPSFESTISLPNGRKISFNCIHPVPPKHFEKYPDNAHQKEEAMEKLGAEILDRTNPTIVAGDLNDVVWGYVDALTGTKNLLFDVRVGRGFYNSFNAHNIFMRWPLDHVFVSREFHLKKLERLPGIGSDHFPIYVELTL